jgi:hypothetical protein
MLDMNVGGYGERGKGILKDWWGELGPRPALRTVGLKGTLQAEGYGAESAGVLA